MLSDWHAGTIFIICDGFTLYRSDDVSGPWEYVATIIALGGPEGNYEDPYLWIDDSTGTPVFKAFWCERASSVYPAPSSLPRSGCETLVYSRRRVVPCVVVEVVSSSVKASRPAPAGVSGRATYS